MARGPAAPAPEAREEREETAIPGLAMPPPAASRLELVLAGLLLTTIFAVLSVRLYSIQIVQSDALSARMEPILATSRPHLGRRGSIVSDSGGVRCIWAMEVPRFHVAIDPGRLPEGADPADVIDGICRELALPEAARRDRLRRLADNRAAVERGEGRPMRYLGLARSLNVEQVDRVRAFLEPAWGSDPVWLSVSDAHHREYPNGDLLGPVLGGVRMGERLEDIRGAGGLEHKLESYLGSADGVHNGIKDAGRRGRFVWTTDIAVPAMHGYDVVLTIDARIQRIVEEELAKGVANMRAESGCAVVLDCANGDVLALANHPGFDPNHLGKYPTEELAIRRKNRVVESVFEPGSTIKPFWAAAALEAGLFHPDQMVWGGGASAVVLGRRVADVSDHGPLTFVQSVVYSSNIALSHIALALGKERMNDALDRFCFQSRTGILLPGERRGTRMPIDKWKDRTTTISASFGFALSVTPLQLAAGYVSLVNGGRYFAPRLVKRLELDGKAHELPVVEKAPPIRPETSARMREILHRVVEEGTGRAHKIAELPFGGKTGTAAISKGRAGYNAGGKEYLSSFVAYAPHPEPRLVLLVMIEKPKRAHYGSTVCGPVVQASLRRIFRVQGGEG